jgi:hypothetical protein
MRYFEIVEFNTSMNSIVRMIEHSDTGELKCIECNDHAFFLKNNSDGAIYECKPHRIHAVKVVPEIWDSPDRTPDVLRVVGCQFILSKGMPLPGNVIFVDVSGGSRADVREEYSLYELSEPQCWYIPMARAHKLGIAG